MSEAAVIYGRFQPLSKAHYNMIKYVIKEHNNVYIMPVQGEAAYTTTAKTEKGKQSQMTKKLDRNPLPIGLRTELIQKAFPMLKNNILKLTRGSIISAYEEIKRMTNKLYETIYIYCGEDEYESYKRQADQMMEKDDYSHLNVIVEKYDEGTRIKTSTGEIESTVSGSQLRKIIALPDKEEAYKQYQKMIAPPLSDKETFQKLRSALKKIQRLNIEEELHSMLNKLGVI